MQFIKKKKNICGTNQSLVNIGGQIIRKIKKINKSSYKNVAEHFFFLFQLNLPIVVEFDFIEKKKSPKMSFT